MKCFPLPCTCFSHRKRGTSKTKKPAFREFLYLPPKIFSHPGCKVTISMLDRRCSFLCFLPIERERRRSGGFAHLAVGQNQWYHFGVATHFSPFLWDWDVHRGYRILTQAISENSRTPIRDSTQVCKAYTGTAPEACKESEPKAKVSFVYV